MQVQNEHSNTISCYPLGHPSLRRWRDFVFARSRLLAWLILLMSWSWWGARAAEFSRSTSDLQFFENRIRPVLIERCHECHSAKSSKIKGGLRLDSRDAILQGGDTGPALVAGNPDRSRIIEAIRYDNVDFQMPPKGKLSDQEIADFEAWIRQGAAWPDHEDSVADLPDPREQFDLEKRAASHWAWQPPRNVVPPPQDVPSWSDHPIDAFILKSLEKHDLAPAPHASRRALLRRATFDLVGLPPTREEIHRFLEDDSPEAFARVIDRLLDSPHFGERWARHWLDLVRYAETLGHEFDYSIHDAWRYRDYVIRAFNQDLPYDRFVLEQVAGDLLPNPRLDPSTGNNESIIGTGFYWLGQQTHSPVDVKAHEVEVIDNQIDVLSKTFLGMTVACARCHDHKFDAIATRDFYALYGILGSSRYALQPIDDPTQRKALRTSMFETRERVSQAWRQSQRDAPARLEEALLRSAKHLRPTPSQSSEPKLLPEEDWESTWKDEDLKRPDHPLHAWWRLALLAPDKPWETRLTEWRKWLQSASKPLQDAMSGVTILHGLAEEPSNAWFASRESFLEPRPTPSVTWEWTSTNTLRLVEPGWRHSGLLSRKFQGALRSPTFEITNRYLHVQTRGQASRMNVVVDHYTLIRNPIYGTLKRPIDSSNPKWITVDLNMWQGHRAYIEIIDQSSPDPADTLRTGGYGEDGYAAVGLVVLSDHPDPPPRRPVRALPELITLKEQASVSLPEVARAYAQALQNTLNGMNPAIEAKPPVELSHIRLVNWLLDDGFMPPAENARANLERALADYRRRAEDVSPPTLVTAMEEGNGYDEFVFIRGNHKTPGPLAARQVPQALAHLAPVPSSSSTDCGPGSGRLHLARALVHPENPLTARVMVNRIWQHLMGRGLVGTPDDFGVLGEPPSHPELLDWLAREFQAQGWSVKRMIRLIMTSQTYQMSSRPRNSQAEEIDPSNRWFHRMNVKRMEGEVIRDSILAVAGTLDPAMHGPSVPVHLTSFMNGRGRPSQNGPVDGQGRRSIYVEVRRNFLSPMMLAYDAPIPFTTVGKRSSSNVPAQALIMMNDPFILQQAEHWARKVLSRSDLGPETRLHHMFESALGRLPDPLEASEMLDFMARQRPLYHDDPDPTRADHRIWSDLAQVIFNMKEFVLVP